MSSLGENWPSVLLCFFLRGEIGCHLPVHVETVFHLSVSLALLSRKSYVLEFVSYSLGHNVDGIAFSLPTCVFM